MASAGSTAPGRNGCRRATGASSRPTIRGRGRERSDGGARTCRRGGCRWGEAALLDPRRYRDWLGLMADDVEYWMPIRRTVTNADLDREFTKPGEVAFFDDDRGYLGMGAKKLAGGCA